MTPFEAEPLFSEENCVSKRKNLREHLYDFVLRLPVRIAVYFAYFSCFVVAYWLAFAVRFDFDLGKHGLAAFYSSLPWVVAVKAAIFFWHRHFRNYWFYTTLRDFQALAKSALFSSVSIFLLSHYVFNIAIPRTVPVLDCMFTIFLIGVARFGWRTLRQDILPRIARNSRHKTLIVGANYAGASLARELCDHPELGYHIVGFLSVHPGKVGQLIGHVPILGSFDEVSNLLTFHDIKEILIIPDVLDGKQLRKVMQTCHERGVRIRIIPSMETRLGGDSIPMRDIKIEDLLKRDPVELDDAIIEKMLTDKTILVTGAGGSIGSEICRQIVRFKPKTLLILGRGENRIFFLEQELRQAGFDGDLVALIADVSNETRMKRIFENHSPDVVFHAAAHKHVPLMEANVSEAVNNNIRGTKVVADLADRFGVSTFVLISTDKAVNPTSVMGATKHMAERYIHALSGKSNTRFITTRFGNVLGSAGSVVQVFRRQIARGGPITITDIRMTRYFMTIPEASQLVLQAAAMGAGGEIFVLDMGEPVRIVDLAKDLIRLSGLPENAIEIRETGMRPGEKLFEELYFEDEKAIRTSHQKLRCASHRRFALEQVEEQIQYLLDVAAERPEAVRGAVQEIIAEYCPPRHAAIGVRPHAPTIPLIVDEFGKKKIV